MPKSPPPTSFFHEVMAQHHARLERVAEKRGVFRLKKIYEESQAEVARKVQRLVRSGKGATFTAHEQRIVLAQLTDGQAMVADRMTRELGDAARDAQQDTLRSLTRDVTRLERKFTGTAPVLPVEDAARFAGVIDARATSLLKRHKESLADYGAGTVAKMEQALAKSLLQGESQMAAIDRIVEIADVEWWRGERIVRTELAHASNATQADGLKVAREEIPDMMMQWRELVSDDGEPLDDRVGIDSMALHGQVVKPGDLFVTPSRAPDGEDVGDLAYERIAFPPNRPNDRAVVAPWRASWGIPGWRFAGGRRVPVR